MRSILMFLVAFLALCTALPVLGEEKQTTVAVNQWIKLDKARIGPRSDPALVYDPVAKRFLVLGGGMEIRNYNQNPHPYDDLALDESAGQWENLFPAGKNWGPKFGDATPPGFKNEVFDLIDKEGNVRPNLGTYRGVWDYNQYAYDSDRKRGWFYARGHTVSYDPATRTWQDLAPATQPTGGKDKPPLLWGSMCYDPVNKKVLLFGGGNVQTERGDPGTWIYDPATNSWSQVQFKSAALDEPRKQGQRLQIRTKALAEAVRARYFRAELSADKQIHRAEQATRLAADIAALGESLKKAGSSADQQEKQQITWAMPEVETAW